MCIIVLDKVGGKITEEQIRNMYTRNSDGFGIVPLEGQRRPHKIGNPSSADEIVDMWKVFAGKPYAMHLRLKTHGDIDVENCHPYALFEGENEWLFHNGVMASVVPTVDKKMSDTWHLAQFFINPMGPKIFEYLKQEHFRECFGKMIGTTNKLLFVSQDEVALVNEKSGTWRDSDLWLSNTFAVDTPHKTYDSTTYYYSANYKHTPTKKETSASTPWKSRSGAARKVLTAPTNPFEKEYLLDMTLNDLSACLRIVPSLLLPAVKKHFGIDVATPKTLQEVRVRGLELYCGIAQSHGDK